MNTQNPFFTIVIPTFGRERQLRACLESIEALSFPRRELQVVIVDDGGPADLKNLIEGRLASLDISLLRIPHGGPAAARNAGARIARGRFIAFTDDDCRPDANWLSTLEQRLRDHPNSMVGGAVVNGAVANPYSVASQVILEMVYAHYNPEPDKASFLASNNMAMSAEIFSVLGGFDATFQRAAAEDRDLCERWKHAGYGMTYAPEAIVYHQHELTFFGFCRQHFNYGSGAWTFHRRRAARGYSQLRDHTSLHLNLFRLMRAPIAKLPARQRISVLGLLTVWQVANAAGFFHAARVLHRAKKAPAQVSS